MDVNYYDLCRVCTANSEEKINVFSMEGKRKNLISKVAECLSLNIDEKDRLPKVLCTQCVQHVESNLEFRNICKKSQTTLTNWLNSATGGKVYIKDEVAPGSGKSLSVLSDVGTTQASLPIGQNQNQQPKILQGGDLFNSIIQVTGLQQQAVDVNQVGDRQPMPQYTITLDNKLAKTVTFDSSKLQHQQPNPKDVKTNTLEEFLKQKPNIKVTTIKKGVQKQQEQPQSQLQQTQQQQHVQNIQPQHITIQAPILPVQTQTQQTTTQLPQQITPLQLQQLQQQLQQQWNQQQFQQPLQQQFTQLQPQQITITAPTTQTTLNTNATTATQNTALSPSKSKKPKINFVITPSTATAQTTSNGTATMLPQLTANQCVTTSGQQPHIQLQLQPTLNTLKQQQQQQQHQQQQHDQQQQQQPQVNAAPFLSNLVPLLQQTFGISTPLGTANGSTVLSPNKCFLPITITDENSEQQIVAHIDAKNFVLPTTYQLQMKLQPQIATADGQPIMQLTPTSIPATLQLTPQALNNQTFQALLNSTNNLQQNQILQTHLQQQTQHQHQQQPQNQLIQSTIQTTMQTQPQQQQQQQQHYAQPLITSHQIIRPANNANNNDNNNITNDVATSTNEQQTDDTLKLKAQTIPQQKYKITHLPGNTIEITPTTDFQQTEQQPVIKQKTQQQQQHQQLQAITAPTQYGGITVQRISTTPKLLTTNKTIAQQQQQQQVTANATTTVNSVQKANVWNKQNVTISRIPVQTQTQQSQQQQQQQQQQKQLKFSQNAVKTVQKQLPIGNKTSTSTQSAQQQVQKTQKPQQQLQQQQIQQQAAKSVTNSPNMVKKVIRRVPSNVVSTTQVPLNQQQQQKQQQHQQQQQQQPRNDAKNPTITTTAVIDTKERTTNVELSSNISVKGETIPKSPTTTTKTGETKAVKRDSSGIQKTSTSTTSTSKTPQQNDNTTNTPAFVCGQCQRKFKKKENLTQHAKLHDDVKPFKCDKEDCGKSFRRKEHLMRHMLSHSGAKNFICDVCQKSFSRKDNLNKHKRIHSATQNSCNYFCDVCNKSFAVKAYYEEHKAMHEKQETATDSPPKKKSNNNNIVQRTTTLPQHQHQQQQQPPTQQIQIVQQPEQQQSQQQQQPQQQQIMHLQLPTVVTTQDLAGNTITITQSNDPNKSIGTHDATVLNLPSHLANFVQLGQTQFVNTSTGQIVGHIKIQK